MDLKALLVAQVALDLILLALILFKLRRSPISVQDLKPATEVMESLRDHFTRWESDSKELLEAFGKRLQELRSMREDLDRAELRISGLLERIKGLHEERDRVRQITAGPSEDPYMEAVELLRKGRELGEVARLTGLHPKEVELIRGIQIGRRNKTL